MRQIEVCNRGQCCNKQWYLCRTGVITASTAHEVITIIKKVRKGGGGVVNTWSLKEKISGMTFVNSNIPALKYGRDMEKYITNYHQVFFQNALFQNVSWFSTKPCCTLGKVLIA